MFDAAEQPRRVEFIDMPAGLSGQYQYFTEARMQQLRSAGYERPFTPLEEGIGKYIRNYLATKDPYR
jgi:ADP-L-glycero-D-manno-heptose 6-epimerase